MDDCFPGNIYHALLFSPDVSAYMINWRRTIFCSIIFIPNQDIIHLAADFMI